MQSVKSSSLKRENHTDKFFRILVLALLLCFTSTLKAGDDICSATVLLVNGGIQEFDNTTTTNSAIANPPFGGYIGPDTWIEFQMPAGQLYLFMDEISMINPAIAIYEGPCEDPKLLYNVLDNNCNGEASPALLIENLTAGETYFMRVWAENGSQNGTFLVSFTDFINSLPNFDVFDDASVNGDCITLTPAQGGQQGCAWYQIPIDFNEAFSHTMTARFGSQDAGGADGLCLVYQTASSDYCGGTGEGIGAAGMPNSAIFEFDTWQNTNLNDPVEDHSSFNINGNMNHNNSINGPVSLANIEDGADHTIDFDWNPVGNMYSLSLDGVELYSGSFDFITNCFGGDNLAYWGFTSATGGATNLHVICPEVESYFPSTIDYIEVDLCEGDSYNNLFEAGYYTEFSPGQNGCNHQDNILINVYELSPPHEIDTTICQGETVVINNQVFTLPSTYFINTQTAIGCDSSIILNLEVIELDVAFDFPPILTCEFEEFMLGATVNTNVSQDMVSYLWSQNGATTDSILITEPGDYTVIVSIDVEGKTCQTFEMVTVFADNDGPVIENIEDIFLDCETSDSTFQLINNSSTNNADVSWIFDGMIVSTDSAVQVLGPGDYIFSLQNLGTGCTSSDTVSVIASAGEPTISLQSLNLDCETIEVIPEVTASNDVISYNWFAGSSMIGNLEELVIDSSGTYILQVANGNGCTAETQITISQDTVAPIFDIENGTILCDSISVTINTNLSTDYTYDLSGPEDIEINLDSLLISETGQYIITAENPENHCVHNDTFEINTLGSSPSIDFISDTLDCNTLLFDLASISDIDVLNYTWESAGDIISTDSLLEVTIPETYCLTATSMTGCSTKDSIIVSQNILAPIVELSADTLDCANPTTQITYNNQSNYSTTWSDIAGNTFTSDTLLVSQPTSYFIDVENLDNGCHSFDTINIFTNSILPDFQVQNDILNCNISEVALDLIINNAYDSISWSGPSFFESDQENPIINEAGIYDLYVDLGGGCIIDTFISIIENITIPELEVDFDSITCSSNTAEITLQFDDSSSADLITPNQLTLENITTYSTEIPGEYSTIITGNNGCADTINFEILAFTDIPSLSVTDMGVISCISEISGFTTLAPDAVNFNWTGPNGFVSDLSDITINSGGEYTLSIIDQFGCVNDTTIFIEEFLDIPIIEVDGGMLDCISIETDLNVFGQGNTDFIQWTLGGSDISNQASISVSESGLYYCEVINEFGCAALDSFLVLENTDSPLITPLTEINLVFFPEDTETEVLIDVDSDVEYDLIWLPENAVSCPTCESTTLEDLSIDSLIVIVENTFGCMDTLVFQIRKESLPNIMVPNIFTPNDDGQNDNFTLFANEEIAEITTMLIYDRWGNKVAEKNNFAPNDPQIGWDGKFNNSPVQQGVYAYYFQVLTVKNEILVEIGDVTVMR